MKNDIYLDIKLKKKYIYIFICISFLLLLSKYLYLDNSIEKNINLFLIFSILLFVVLAPIYMLFRDIKLKSEINKELLDIEEKNRLVPFEIAMDYSQEAIHWFTKDGKYIYVNNATCEMDGYSKEEFKNMYLNEIDKNFKKEDVMALMQEIIDTPNWSITSTHTRKDGKVITLDITGDGFRYNNKDYICAFARNITKKVEYEKNISIVNNKLKKSLKEKEILLKEIHHRVKNNMEIINSILNIQVRRAKNVEFTSIINEAQSRIHTMALVHEYLYLGYDLSSINIKLYITKLLSDIKSSYYEEGKDITIDLNIDLFYMSMDKSIQIGMVINEICINSFKYAFKENTLNLLCIHLVKSEDHIILKIRDNGDGLENLDILNKSGSIGMQLIKSIVEDQLNGELLHRNNNGLEFIITFTVEGDKDE
ncbi:histidine kinase dimerization/phosphoacceptor domain -containing protein [Sulfurimonas sp.]|uniref:histidine kinase dimerization/phosphoacceptor domain -containing protein n=1 Tax=Sulfurimonas sp. TaxID=2022749 RepID=UPI002B45B7DC|nr:histidine kinase dimerization/phosphoacceptor domain -containing protein [Sulfurimonas sp.]